MVSLLWRSCDLMDAFISICCRISLFRSSNCVCNGSTEDLVRLEKNLIQSWYDALAVGTKVVSSTPSED